MATKIKVDGLRQLGEALRGLAAETSNKIARSAVNVGAQVVKKAAAARAPVSDQPHQLGRRKDQVVQPGNLRRNIIVKRLPRGETDLTAESYVTVRRGSGRAPDDAFYWRFVEFGTVKMAPRPFLRPALSENAARVTTRMSEVLRRRIEREARRLAAKGPRK